MPKEKTKKNSEVRFAMCLLTACWRWYFEKIGDWNYKTWHWDHHSKNWVIVESAVLSTIHLVLWSLSEWLSGKSCQGAPKVILEEIGDWNHEACPLGPSLRTSVSLKKVLWCKRFILSCDLYQRDYQVRVIRGAPKRKLWQNRRLKSQNVTPGLFVKLLQFFFVSDKFTLC